MTQIKRRLSRWWKNNREWMITSSVLTIVVVATFTVATNLI
jgi:predicted negative regulator of RcsB-dependent stress response